MEPLRPEEEQSTARFSYEGDEMNQGMYFILDFTVHPRTEIEIANR